MDTRSKAFGNALATTALVALIAGAVLGPALYLIAIGGAQFLIALSWISPTGSAGHAKILIAVAAAIATPLTVAIAVWTFRNALDGERALERDRAAADDRRADAA